MWISPSCRIAVSVDVAHRRASSDGSTGTAGDQGRQAVEGRADEQVKTVLRPAPPAPAAMRYSAWM